MEDNVRKNNIAVSIAAGFAIAVIAFCAAGCDDGLESTPATPSNRHVHKWGSWTVTETEGTEERFCTIDNTHRETRLTGTERFTFEPIGNIAYRVKGGLLTDGEVIIPDFYRPNKSYPFLHVTEIGGISDDYFHSAFEHYYFMTSVYIPASVTTIGTWAFGHCTELATVTITEDSHLAIIGAEAFYDCYSLTGITIPAGVMEIGNDAFKDCFNLTTLTIAEDSRLARIGRSAFLDCENIISIAIPVGVTEIGSDAFRGCTKLAEITFAEYSRLTRIGSDAFDGTAITGMAIPVGVTEIGARAFEHCAKLTTVTFAAGIQLVSIGNDAFYKSGLKSIIIPASVTEIGMSAFEHCDDLETVTFEEDSQIDRIATRLFYSTTKVERVIIPASVKHLGSDIFANWTPAQTVYFAGFSSKARANAACGDNNDYWYEWSGATIKYWDGHNWVD
jgi:hypothetical protein